MAAKRKRYDDKFRASAVVMLEAAGYPGREGALASTAKHLNMPHNTLRNWFHGVHNPAPSQDRQEKKMELSDMLRTEINAILGDMPKARDGASYRDLGTVAGILIDKLQLITGKPTERNEINDTSLTDEQRANRITAILDRARARRDRQVGGDSSE
jgi:transposase-like protein